MYLAKLHRSKKSAIVLSKATPEPYKAPGRHCESVRTLARQSVIPRQTIKSASVLSKATLDARNFPTASLRTVPPSQRSWLYGDGNPYSFGTLVRFNSMIHRGDGLPRFTRNDAEEGCVSC